MMRHQTGGDVQCNTDDSIQFSIGPPSTVLRPLFLQPLRYEPPMSLAAAPYLHWLFQFPTATHTKEKQEAKAVVCCKRSCRWEGPRYAKTKVFSLGTECISRKVCEETRWGCYGYLGNALLRWVPASYQSLAWCLSGLFDRFACWFICMVKSFMCAEEKMYFYITES